MEYIMCGGFWGVIFIICALVEGLFCGHHEERLLDDLFFRKGYSKLARPVEEESDALEVQFGLTLQQIIEVDEKNEMLHTNMWLNYMWHDYKLSWNEDDYGGVKSIRLPSDKIWSPDILLYNSADEDIDSKFPVNIVVYSSGLCSWIPLGLYISACSINIRWFPFDDQYCKMKFGSWTYDGSKINLTILDGYQKINIDTYTPSGEWDLIDREAIRSVEYYDCCPEPYIDITYYIHIRRRTLYYGFNLIIPCALISSLAPLIFMLPPDAGEKIGLGITILLSLSVFSLIVADSTPNTSLAVPLLGVYFGCIMFMCTISVIMTVVVLNFHHRNPDTHEMPSWVRTVICEWLAWLLRMKRPGRDLSREYLLRRAKMRRLEEKNPPSLSLISNVKDVDNSIPLNSEYRTDYGNSIGRPNQNSQHAFYYSKSLDEPPGMSSTSFMSVKGELLGILNELRFITRKLKEEDEKGDEINDWKFAAMVIDRLCFWVFLSFLVVCTIAIFMSVPNLFASGSGI